MASAMPFPPATAASIVMNNYLAVASMALLYYDYCLTLGAEVDRFWRSGKPSPTSVVFVLNRYFGLFGPIPAMFEFFGRFSPERCRQLQLYHQYFAVAIQTITGIILIIRTYALYNRSKRILWVLIVLAGIAMAVTLLVHFVGTVPVTDDVPQRDVQSPSLCDLSLTAKEGLRSAIGWITILIFDTIVIILTLRQTLRMQEGLRIHHSMLRVLFRDGVIYYSILFVVSVANILTFIVPGMDGNSRGIATTFANAMSSTLASRILLHLRDPCLHRGVRQIGQQPLSPRSYIETGYSTVDADTVCSISFGRSTELTEIDAGMADSFEANAPTSFKPPYRGESTRFSEAFECASSGVLGSLCDQVSAEMYVVPSTYLQGSIKLILFSPRARRVGSLEGDERETFVATCGFSVPDDMVGVLVWGKNANFPA